jgi:glycosyltransferase involved in cell wall biosynthesis
MPTISVITPASRGVKQLSQLLRDFRNQTYQNFEHLIIYDGNPPEDVQVLMKEHKDDYNVIFMNIQKDIGNMKMAPGTKPRNHGISLAKGVFLVFADDDDRYKSTFLETLISNASDDTIAVVQMSCQESRMYKGGNPNRFTLVPEVGLPFFPIICHMGTPCFIVKREWAVAEPWRHEPEHDFRFIKRIVEKYKPKINVVPGMQVDVDGQVIKGMLDWVTFPPFFRG